MINFLKIYYLQMKKQIIPYTDWVGNDDGIELFVYVFLKQKQTKNSTPEMEFGIASNASGTHTNKQKI